MRILHTSDWHLGARLGSQDRLPDQLQRLEEVCRYIDEHEVDLLLVAGDVFDEHRAEALAKIIARLARLLTPRAQAGLTCVFIAGNHDREHVFPLLRGLQELVSPEGERRIIFAERPRLEQLAVRSGEKLNLMLLPYPTPSRYDLPDQRWPSPDSKRNALHDEMRNRIKDLSAAVKTLGGGVQTVLCGHFWMRGIKEGLYRVTEQEDIIMDQSDIPAYAYTALGHIHKPQQAGAPYIQYCGSVERMDRGEEGDQKRVLLAEVTRSGLQDVKPLPLNATPFFHARAAAEAELEEQAAALAEPERTLVSVTFQLRRGDPFGALQAAARRLFPRLYSAPAVEWQDEPQSLRQAFELDRRDVPGTVRAYLKQHLQDDEDAEAMLALAEELLVETGAART